MFKSYPLCDWVRFVEAYGQPLRLGKYDKSSTSEDRTVLFRAVRRIGVDIAAKVPEEMNIEFPGESTVQGRSELYKDLVTYIEYQVSIAVLGQLLYAFSPARPGGGNGKGCDPVDLLVPSAGRGRARHRSGEFVPDGGIRGRTQSTRTTTPGTGGRGGMKCRRDETQPSTQSAYLSERHLSGERSGVMPIT